MGKVRSAICSIQPILLAKDPRRRTRDASGIAVRKLVEICGPVRPVCLCRPLDFRELCRGQMANGSRLQVIKCKCR